MYNVKCRKRKVDYHCTNLYESAMSDIEKSKVDIHCTNLFECPMYNIERAK